MTSALTLSYTPENLETDGNNRPNRRAFVNRNSESTLKVSAQRGTNVQDPVCNVFRGSMSVLAEEVRDRKSGPPDSDFSAQPRDVTVLTRFDMQRSSLDQPIRAHEQRWRHVEPERLCRLEVDHQL